MSSADIAVAIDRCESLGRAIGQFSDSPQISRLRLQLKIALNDLRAELGKRSKWPSG